VGTAVVVVHTAQVEKEGDSDDVLVARARLTQPELECQWPALAAGRIELPVARVARKKRSDPITVVSASTPLPVDSESESRAVPNSNLNFKSVTVHWQLCTASASGRGTGCRTGELSY
jgi:hypothetical protein